MRKIENQRITAKDVQPGTIVIPFIGDGRFDVGDVENTPQGSTVLIDRYRDLRVEMDGRNPVEILGYFNLD